MGAIRVRLSGLLEALRASMWLIPTLAILTALVGVRVLVALEPTPSWIPAELVFDGSSDGARSVLTVLAGSTVTVVGLVFSLTVIALQMASSQFSPRLLRSFLADRGVQIVLGGMLASAVFDVGVLSTVRTPVEDLDVFVPRLALSVAMLLALVSVGLLVYFLHHVTRMLRVDVLMGTIASETLAKLTQLSHGRAVLPDVPGPDPPPEATVISARRGGYLQRTDVAAIGSIAQELGITVRLRPVIGEWVTPGTTLAWVWGEGDPRSVDLHRAADLVHDNLHLGPDRTESSDVALGVRQLQDIAARALSPGVNDPTTAVQAIGQMSAVLSAMASHPLGARIASEAGTIRAIGPGPAFGAYLELAVGQSRRYGRLEPDVLLALIGLLTDVAEHTADNADRAAVVRRHIDRVEASADLDDDEDLARVHAAADRARRTLEAGARPVTESDAG